MSIPVPGSGDFVLSGANLNRISYRFTGALTGNRRIVVPNTTQQYWVDNQTTGAFTLTISTAAQVGPPTIGPGDTVIFYCDTVDVINAVNTAAIALPVLIAQGGTSATTAPVALSNLGGVAEALILTAGIGMAGGGDLSAPRTFDFDLDSLPIAVPDVAADFMAFSDTDAAGISAKVLMSDVIGITVQDEGAPVGTLASTLDFVGAAVTVTGAGAVKTITFTGLAAPIILLDGEQIRFGTGNDAQMEYDGSNMLFLGGQDWFIDSSLAQANKLCMMNFSGGVALQIETNGDASINDVVQGTGAFVRTYIDMFQSDGEVHIGWGGVGVLRTAPVSGAAYPYFGTSGGALLNNNTTGSGANERILTYIDHAMTGGISDDRNLTTTMAADNRLVAGFGRRQGYVKFEVYASFSKVGGTTNIEFDFNGTFISELSYIYDWRTADGTPNGAGASDDAATNQSLTLGSAGERTYLRITGYARFSAFSTLEFRWKPTVSQVDTCSRNRGGWMTISPVLIE